MNGTDKIISRIKSDCDESIKAIESEAEKKHNAIMAEAEKQIEAKRAETASKAEITVNRIKASSQSKAELEIRNALLKRRRQEIDKTIDSIYEYLQNLDDSKYFSVIYRLAKKLEGNEGELFLNKRDLSRLPSDFSEKINEAGLKATVSDTPVNIIGGFILKRGDIEENMDFNAVISSRRDEIEDIINRELFAR